MTKFILYIDYKTNKTNRGPHGKTYEYRDMTASGAIAAIEEADKIWNELGDSVYLMRIMAKIGKTVTPYHAGYKYVEYSAVLCRRSFGWHSNTPENSENAHTVMRCVGTEKYSKDSVWYE